MSEHHFHHHFHHHVEARCEVMRRLDALDDKIDLNQEKIMATLEELTGLLTEIGTEVDNVGKDTDKLLADLAAIPTPGMTPEQQQAVNDAVTSATAIRDRLKALDDKVPNATA